MNKQNLDTMAELHHRKVRVERSLTDAIIWFLYLYGASALFYVCWLLFFPVSDEERFYTAACKYDVAEMPAVVRSTCAAIKARQ